MFAQMTIAGETAKNVDFNEYFEMIRELGEGQYGSVVLARLKKDYGALPKDSRVAIKLIDSENLSSADIKQISREIAVLKSISLCNPGISCYYDYFTTNIGVRKYIVIIMEYIPGVELVEEIKLISPDKYRKVMKSLARTLGYLHSSKIVHKDIKPANIMITPTGDLKYIDFGFACLLISGHEHACEKDVKGSAVFISPERFKTIIDETELSDKELYEMYKKSDVWALGMVFYDLLFKEYPPQVEEAADFDDIVDAYIQPEPITFPTGSSVEPKLVEIVKKMLQKDPKKRSTINEVISELEI